MTPRWYINCAVVMSGVSILAAEILGARLIGTFYGTGLYLWSALIAVTLGALSMGFWLGGRWAARDLRLDRFCALLGGAGLWFAVIPWIRHPILATTESIGLRSAVLATACILFFPPLALLGMASPCALRLKTTSIEIAGRTAGGLCAISALTGAAALLVSLVLIPTVGVQRLAFLAGVSLIVIALIGAALSRGKTAPALIAIIAVIAAAVFAAPRGRTNAERGLVTVAQSPYAEIRVVEAGGQRLLLIDGMVHTEVDTLTLGSSSEYVEVLDLARGFFSAPGRLLLMGLGGGALAKRFTARGWSVDAVEMDPAVVRMARDYFNVAPSDARIHRMDGRGFLTKDTGMYDLIIMDAPGTGSLPFHLVTREAFAQYRTRLAPGGVLALNVIAVGWRDRLARSLAATLNEAFARVIVLPIAEPPDQLGNLILLASNSELELLEEPPRPWDRFSPEYTRAHAWDNRFEIDPAGEQIITDDLNPVELWAERINLAQRKALHEHFGREGIVW